MAEVGVVCTGGKVLPRGGPASRDVSGSAPSIDEIDILLPGRCDDDARASREKGGGGSEALEGCDVAEY